MNDFFPFTVRFSWRITHRYAQRLLLMLAIGRIAGISGILGQALSKAECK